MHVNLYVKRRENKLTHKQIAKKIGMHPNTYALKESQDSDFTLHEAQKLAKLFNCTLDELFEEEAHEA